MTAGLKMAQETDQSGGIGAEGQKRRPYLRMHHGEVKRAAGVEVGFIDPATNADAAEVKLIRAFRFLCDDVLVHGPILAGEQKAQIT
jgi:hypothetical protein